MKVKPKEVLVNLPAISMSDNEDDAPMMASHFNTFLHGKVRLKYEILGKLGGQNVALFYLQRNNEFQQLRDDFMKMINAEEEGTVLQPEELEPVEKEDHHICLDCDALSQLHFKGLNHCVCGEEWDMRRNKCETQV